MARFRPNLLKTSVPSISLDCVITAFLLASKHICSIFEPVIPSEAADRALISMWSDENGFKKCCHKHSLNARSGKGIGIRNPNLRQMALSSKES